MSRQLIEAKTTTTTTEGGKGSMGRKWSKEEFGHDNDDDMRSRTILLYEPQRVQEDKDQLVRQEQEDGEEDRRRHRVELGG